jgi:hypothetical protein
MSAMRKNEFPHGKSQQKLLSCHTMMRWPRCLKAGNHHSWSNKDQMNMTMTPMCTEIESGKVGAAVKWVSSCRILENAGEIAAVMPAANTKKPGNHHFWSVRARIKVQMAPMYTGIEARKVSYEEKRVSLWLILTKAGEMAPVMSATDMKKARESPFLVRSSPNHNPNGSNVHGYRGAQGLLWGGIYLLIANLGKSS